MIIVNPNIQMGLNEMISVETDYTKVVIDYKPNQVTILITNPKDSRTFYVQNGKIKEHFRENGVSHFYVPGTANLCAACGLQAADPIHPQRGE